MKILLISIALLLSGCELKTGEGVCADKCGNKGYKYTRALVGADASCTCGTETK